METVRLIEKLYDITPNMSKINVLDDRHMRLLYGDRFLGLRYNDI